MRSQYWPLYAVEVRTPAGIERIEVLEISYVDD